jgi:hypothetical protein
MNSICIDKTNNLERGFSESQSLLPVYRLFHEDDRENNVVTRQVTGTATDCIEGVRVSASTFRDGRGGVAYVISATRPGFSSREFSAVTWQEAFAKGSVYRLKHLQPPVRI